MFNVKEQVSLNLGDITYPHLNRIALLYPGPGMILGEELLWQPKHDGSNVRFYLDNEDNLIMGSRNQPIADPSFLSIARSIDDGQLLENIKELLLDARNWSNNYILYGELMAKGRSPTRIKTYDQPSFVAFDLWTSKTQQFTHYNFLHQQCHHSNIPCIDVQVITRHTSIEDLYTYRDSMLRDHQDIEGFVIKSYKPSYNNGLLAVKEKHDTLKLDKIPKDIDPNKVELPPLSDSEIYGALDKVLADIGPEQFKNVKIAMPIIAKQVSTEARKHFMSPPRSIFTYYQNKLEDMNST